MCTPLNNVRAGSRDSCKSGEPGGHPFMTSTRRRGGGQAQVDACERGEGVQLMWKFTQKIN